MEFEFFKQGPTRVATAKVLLQDILDKVRHYQLADLVENNLFVGC